MLKYEQACIRPILQRNDLATGSLNMKIDWTVELNLLYTIIRYRQPTYFLWSLVPYTTIRTVRLLGDWTVELNLLYTIIRYRQPTYFLWSQWCHIQQLGQYAC